ncbi:MAG: hypothetical protein ABR569_03285 [Gaiellaceae bacterium]
MPTSTSPEPTRESPEDRIVNLLSRWLARHLGDRELRERVEAIGTASLSHDQAGAVDEVLAALASGPPGRLEVAVREALESLAMG